MHKKKASTIWNLNTNTAFILGPNKKRGKQSNCPVAHFMCIHVLRNEIHAGISYDTAAHIVTSRLEVVNIIIISTESVFLATRKILKITTRSFLCFPIIIS